MASMREISTNLAHLQEKLVAFHGPNHNYPLPTRPEMIDRVETYIQLIVAAVCQGDWPFALPIHGQGDGATLSWSRARTKDRCLLVFHLLAKVHSLLRTGSTSTKRDIYYEDVNIWGNQAVLDQTVIQLTKLLNVPRRCLNINATSKGLVAGSLTFLDCNNRLVDCSSPNGVMIPEDVDGLNQLRTNARLILVVEKDSTFQKLIDDGVERFIGPCILVTGKGFPDVNTRRFLRRIYDDLLLPPLALVDADPHGFAIMSTYRFGNLEESGDTEHMMVTPQLRFIGLQPTDIEVLRLPDEAKVPLNQRDRCLIETLLARPTFAQNVLLHNQLTTLRRLECKVEIQGLTKIHQNFLTRTYLPAKLQTRSWM